MCQCPCINDAVIGCVVVDDLCGMLQLLLLLLTPPKNGCFIFATTSHEEEHRHR
jgi:hypothetical protein